jgi:hypothetical protein
VQPGTAVPTRVYRYNIHTKLAPTKQFFYQLACRCSTSLYWYTKYLTYYVYTIYICVSIYISHNDIKRDAIIFLTMNTKYRPAKGISTGIIVE